MKIIPAICAVLLISSAGAATATRRLSGEAQGDAHYVRASFDRFICEVPSSWRQAYRYGPERRRGEPQFLEAVWSKRQSGGPPSLQVTTYFSSHPKVPTADAFVQQSAPSGAAKKLHTSALRDAWRFDDEDAESGLRVSYAVIPADDRRYHVLQYVASSEDHPSHLKDFKHFVNTFSPAGPSTRK